MSIIDILKYIILGIIQGITEPLPISSSGHLLIFGNLFNTNLFNDFNFEIMIHFGSTIAIICVFKNDIIKLINIFIQYIKTKNNYYKSDFNYIMLLIIATIPTGIIGFLLKDAVESIFLSNIKIVGFNLLVTGTLLYIIRDYKGIKNDNDIKSKDSLIVGLFQSIAIVPGISRSGSTVVGAMLNNFKRSTALKFSFFLYIPVSIAGFILGIKDIIYSDQLAIIWLPYMLGTIASAITTYYVIKWFIKVAIEGKLIYFAYYCFTIGTLVILFM